MWKKRLMLVVALALVIMGLSACYKDAGDNVQPTSNQVNLTDIAPHTPTPTSTLTPTPQPVTPTRTSIPTLVPTTTPADGGSQTSPVVEPTATTAVPVQVESTSAPQLAPSFTPMVVETATPSGPVIETPGMSDIQPSSTPPPTLDPANMPTPTAIPIEENPCIHIVKANDTLYSIAQSNEVLLADLVVFNADLLWAGQETPLQIGWQLDIPGCSTGEPTPMPTSLPGESATPPVVAPGEQIVHVVEAGQTIYAIGRLYGVDPLAIIEANNLANPNLLQPGQELIIPAVAGP